MGNLPSTLVAPSNTPQVSSTSTVDPVGVKFLYETCTTTPKFHYKMCHYRHRVPLLPLPSRETTTSTTVEPDPLRKGTLRRYNPETTSVDRMHVLYEMHPMFGPCPNCSLHVRRKPCHRHVGHPVSGITPRHSCTFRAPTLVPLHQHLNRVARTGMLPWHHFRFTAMAPFSFCHGDKCLVS